MAQRPNSTEDAMNRVLETERTAHASVADCETRAASLVEVAQQQARRIHSRTDTRISQVHAHCAGALGRQVETLLQEGAASEEHSTLRDEMRELLQAAVERLAEALTDGSTSDE
jgi:vacuolar-type H+-ATPase subunit H